MATSCGVCHLELPMGQAAQLHISGLSSEHMPGTRDLELSVFHFGRLLTPHPSPSPIQPSRGHIAYIRLSVF